MIAGRIIRQLAVTDVNAVCPFANCKYIQLILIKYTLYILFVYRVYECVHNPNTVRISVIRRRVIKSRDVSRRCSHRRRGIYFL